MKLMLFCILYFKQIKKNKHSLAWARERTIPAKWPPLVDEVSVNFCGESSVA
jgi:hypothetical protein